MNAFNYKTRRAVARSWWVRGAIAAVWLYEGLWCKVLGGSPHQASVASGICGGDGRAALVAVGVGECVIAAWVLSARKPRLAAVAQTALLAAMNAAGLIWARGFIPDPAGMVIQNFAFLTLVWHAISI